MKKTLILAMVGVLLISGSAFAAGRQLVAQPNATFNPGVGGAGFGPATTNNDDSCDIGTAPAATLLLPYFEVDLAAGGRTTVFTITNVSPYSQIAHIVLYTDWSFPVLDFNIFLTGYDVQSLNLFDIVSRGLIAGPSAGTATSLSSPNAFATTSTGINNSIAGATAITTGTNPSAGTQPFRALAGTGNSFGNPNFLGSVATNCASGRLPGQLPGALATDVRLALSVGRVTGSAIGCGTADQIGSDHGANLAVGYVTIDVAATCSQALPTETSYFTGEILFDNVLIGEYFDVSQLATTGNFAGGNPMVHIRAVPEGGGAGQVPTGGTNLPYTFYDRYTFGLVPRTIDRRQPLPSAFAARWISGSTAAFDTQYKIWREGYTGNDIFEALGLLDQCDAVARNEDLDIAEFVRFDENENASVIGLGGIIVSPPPPGAPGLPEAVRISINNTLFPVLISGSTQLGGWMYMNLNNGGNTAALLAGAPASGLYSASRAGFGATATTRDVSQNWVIVSMFAEGRYGTDFDAAWMGNGCSASLPIAAAAPNASGPAGRIAPAGGVLVCPPGTTHTSGGVLNCLGTNTTP